MVQNTVYPNSIHMPSCIITRTHRRGRKLSQRDWPEPVPGPVIFQIARHAELNRELPRLVALRTEANARDSIPPLYEPQILTMMSNQGMILAGFEEIDGQRYYQGWYIQWID